MTPEHPNNYSKLLRQLEDAIELGTRLLNVIPSHWGYLIDALPGQPGAQSYDSDQGGPGAVVVCDRHQRDITACQQEGSTSCTGQHIPKRSDPTGNAGTRHDRATADLRDIRRLGRRIEQDMERLTDLVTAYKPRPANKIERSLTAAKNDDPGCQSCARLEVTKGVDRYEPVYKGITINGGIVQVCRWCHSWITDTGTLPSRDILEAHHRGERIKRPA